MGGRSTQEKGGRFLTFSDQKSGPKYLPVLAGHLWDLETRRQVTRCSRAWGSQEAEYNGPLGEMPGRVDSGAHASRSRPHCSLTVMARLGQAALCHLQSASSHYCECLQPSQPPCGPQMEGNASQRNLSKRKPCAHHGTGGPTSQSGTVCLEQPNAGMPCW